MVNPTCAAPVAGLDLAGFVTYDLRKVFSDKRKDIVMKRNAPVIRPVTLLLCFLLPLACAVQSTAQSAEGGKMSLEKEVFGKTAAGQPVDLYTLTNAQGMKAGIITFGGIVVSLEVPDRNGKLADIVLGFDNLGDYEGEHPYFGALIGRYGNRIRLGKFALDGKEYTLPQNNDMNSLHGGDIGFDKKVWAAKAIEQKDAVGLALEYTSPDGEMGYPGTLKATVTYLLTDDNALRIDYHAVTNQATPVNLTNHSYFNLKGQGEGDILDHVMLINADRFTPVDETLIPTGELAPVKSTPFDFTSPMAIGARVGAEDEQIVFGKGYDHNYVLNKERRCALTLAARVTEESSGRVMETWTTEPGVQFYCGNFLDGSLTGKEGKVYEHRYGFCLETQHYPDSPNQPAFPSTILRPDEVLMSTTIYCFSTK
jgi:aldose 1-epimerase